MRERIGAMVILGLTGSIGMGKSTVALAFRRLGVPVHDADRCVHELTARSGGAVDAVKAAFPGVVRSGTVDHGALAGLVFNRPSALARLEGILHPMVRRRQFRFLQTAARARHRVVVLDVPLLYETGGDEFCDAVVVVSAPAFVQAERVLRRSGMTRERLVAILCRQVSDAQKRRRADFVVATGLDRSSSLKSVRKIVRVTRQWRGTHWPPRPRARQPHRFRAG